MDWLLKFFGIIDSDRCGGICKELHDAQLRNHDAATRLSSMISDDPIVMTVRLVEQAGVL